MEKEIAAAVEPNEPAFWTTNTDGDRTNKPLWINIKRNGQFQLIQPTELSYKNWKANTSHSYRPEYCAVMAYADTNHQWLDKDCSKAAPYVCQYERKLILLL